MEFTAGTIAAFLKGKVEGDENTKVHTISKIEEGTVGALSFLANPLYSKYIYTTEASIVIVNSDFVPDKKLNCTLIKVDDAYQAFASLLEMYSQGKTKKVGIDSLAFIHKSAKIGKDVYIGAFAYISENAIIGDNSIINPHVFIAENVKIGKGCLLHSGVRVFPDCNIGANCVLHGNVVIGADGFGFAPQSSNDYKKVPQVGNVILEDNVEVGANSTIDRATLGSTIIRTGAKLDNLIQIAHNVEIGENTVIAAQTGISGSTKIGKNCMIAGQVGITGHITIADGTKIVAQSGIGAKIVNENTIVQGSPAFDIQKYQRAYVCFRKLPELYDKINELEKKLKELEK